MTESEPINLRDPMVVSAQKEAHLLKIEAEFGDRQNWDSRLAEYFELFVNSIYNPEGDEWIGRLHEVLLIGKFKVLTDEEFERFVKTAGSAA